MERWIEEHDTFFGIAMPIVVLKCSNCGKQQIHTDDGGGMYYKTPYCPWCGAKMENPEIEEP